MKKPLKRRILGAVTIALLSQMLSGCIILPVPGYHHRGPTVIEVEPGYQRQGPPPRERERGWR